METKVVLTIKNHITSIPYPGTEREEAPHQGFRQLKGRPEEVSAIPAVEDSDALKHALVKINAITTPFFTVACRKSFNSEQGSFWARGYIEFSFNYLDIAKDSPNYFLLFEQFNRFIVDTDFDRPVDFNFELQGARFTEIPADGFTACVWITTAEFPTVEGAYMVWNQSVGILAEFLSNFEKPPLPAIYE